MDSEKTIKRTIRGKYETRPVSLLLLNKAQLVTRQFFSANNPPAKFRSPKSKWRDDQRRLRSTEKCIRKIQSVCVFRRDLQMCIRNRLLIGTSWLGDDALSWHALTCKAFKLLALLLFRHRAKISIVQEVHLAISPQLVTRLHLPHTIVVTLHAPLIDVAILTPETVGTIRVWAEAYPCR